MTQAANLAALGSNASSTGTLGASSYASATIPNSALSGNPTFRNRIINGNMMIDQRNAGASVSPNGYTLDRWSVDVSQSSKLTCQQNAGSVTPPTGYTNYLGITSSSAYSVTSGDYFLLRQPIEGYNVADFDFGTANAKTITFSFWVRSSLTGTFGGALRNASSNRSYPFTYTISASNTWEQKSVTVVGDTSGTWLTTNGMGLDLIFSLGVGSNYTGTAGSWAAANYVNATGATSVVGTNGATFYITGVQLEAGIAASPFEQRLYGTELQLCQRYYQQLGGPAYTGIGYGINFSGAQVVRAATVPFIVPMRTTPSVSISGTLIATDRTGFDTDVSSVFGVAAGTTSLGCYFGKTGTSGTDYYPCQIAVKNGTTSYLVLSAEL